jgi:hypothetical protein
MHKGECHNIKSREMLWDLGFMCSAVQEVLELSLRWQECNMRLHRQLEHCLQNF